MRSKRWIHCKCMLFFFIVVIILELLVLKIVLFTLIIQHCAIVDYIVLILKEKKQTVRACACQNHAAVRQHVAQGFPSLWG